MKSTWIPLAVTLAIQSMVAMALLTLPVMAPEAASSLGVSPALVGVYVAIVYGGAMFASLAAGTAVKRWGAIRVSQLGLLLCAFGLALCAVSSVVAIAIGALLIGLGYGPITPASSHLLAKTTAPERMSLVFSVKQTGVPLGGVFAGAIVPGAALMLGWQGALLVAAAANLLCAAIAQPLCRSLDADRDSAQPLVLGSLSQPIRLVLKHPALRMLAACSFVFSMVQLSLTTYLVTYLHDALAYTLIAAGAVLSVAQVGGIAGRVLWGWVADRYMGARNMLAALAALMAVSAIAAAMFSADMPPLLIMAVLVVFGATAIGWNGVYLAEVARQAPAGLASVATGGTLAITFLGVVLGPPVFGAMVELSGTYRISFALLAVPTLACCVLLLLGRKSERLSAAS
ncbi:MFS transporter [Diaphorobacter ruginosibacter]|uniref:MFS transporter n=1 Tax=Diaphorobacter ruginosibacter TaxID=1715720 RepID=UPI00333E7239